MVAIYDLHTTINEDDIRSLQCKSNLWRFGHSFRINTTTEILQILYQVSPIIVIFQVKSTNACFLLQELDSV